MHDPQANQPSDNGAAIQEYRVTWSSDINAASPADAARHALAAMRRAGTTATDFDIAWTEPLDGIHPALEVTTRMHIDLADHRPQHTDSTRGHAIPQLSIDVERAAAWLLEPTQENPTRTNLQYCLLVDDQASNFSDGEYFGSVHILLIAASRADLFGPLVDMRIAFSVDDDGEVDGAMLMTTLHPSDRRSQPLYITTGPLRREQLTWDPGYPAALGVLRVVVALTNAALAANWEYLTTQPPGSEADPAGSGGTPTGLPPDRGGAP